MIRIRSVTRKINITMMALVWAAATLLSGLAVSHDQAYAAGECGAGYGRVGSYAIRDWENNNGDSYAGTLEVYWSGAAKRNCAIARCDSPNCGRSLYREVYIRRTGDVSWNDSDKGWFKSYAGPVYSANASGRCIDVLARFSSTTTGSRGDKGDVYVPRVHCG